MVSIASVQARSSSTTGSASAASASAAFAAMIAALSDQTDDDAGTDGTNPAAGTTTTGTGSAITAQELGSVPIPGPKEIAAFSQDLTRRLEAAGVDTSRPISLKVTSDGHVVAADDDPDKAKIDALFASDPDLENRYRGVSNALELNALARASKVYVEEYDKAKDDKEREAVWRRHMTVVNQITSMSGQLTLSDGMVTSPALDMMGGSSLLG